VEGFSTHTGRTAVYNADNVDTDRIIPARFLSLVTRSGYGDLLFKDVRGEDFPLDQPDAQGASVLVVGTNFGCGSSREHAVWAIQQGGFRAVVAKRTADSAAYSDIFRQNAANCGLLLIELPDEEHDLIASAGSGAEVTIDLPAQTVRMGDHEFRFEINATVKDALVKGLDLIGTTMEYEEAIAAYERESSAFVPSRDSEAVSAS
jgi:3-isopropylmalate/(R)-2-methylmalate dehydratase small subunit